MISQRILPSRKIHKHFKSLRKQKSLAAGVLIAVLLISISLLANYVQVRGSVIVVPTYEKLVNNMNTIGTEIRTNITLENQLFQCEIAYAYVGEGNSTSTSSSFSGNMEYPLTKYPSAIYLNITRLPNSAFDTSDAKFEVYLFEISTDKNKTERYLWIDGTNINPSFSNFTKIESVGAHVDELVDRRTITGQGGHFMFNWTAGMSIVGGCVGSIGCYTNLPSMIGLWSTGAPNTLSVKIHLLGWITLNNDSVTTTANTALNDNVLQINLQKLEVGFIHNKIVPANQLAQIDDVFNPAIYNFTRTER